MLLVQNWTKAHWNVLPSLFSNSSSKGTREILYAFRFWSFKKAGKSGGSSYYTVMHFCNNAACPHIKVQECPDLNHVYPVTSYTRDLPHIHFLQCAFCCVSIPLSFATTFPGSIRHHAAMLLLFHSISSIRFQLIQLTLFSFSLAKAQKAKHQWWSGGVSWYFITARDSLWVRSPTINPQI